MLCAKFYQNLSCSDTSPEEKKWTEWITQHCHRAIPERITWSERKQNRRRSENVWVLILSAPLSSPPSHFCGDISDGGSVDIYNQHVFWSREEQSFCTNHLSLALGSNRTRKEVQASFIIASPSLGILRISWVRWNKLFLQHAPGLPGGSLPVGQISRRHPCQMPKPPHVTMTMKQQSFSHLLKPETTCRS